MYSSYANGFGENYRPSSVSLTKHVDQMYYEIPKYSNPWSTPPEFLKVFGDACVPIGGKVTLDCMLLGNPRPRVTWLFNGQKLQFDDVHTRDTTEICHLSIPSIRYEHYGEYTILAENEVGRAVCSATVTPPTHIEPICRYNNAYGTW